MERTDVYQIVTDRITAALEAGTVPWQKPWAVEHPKNALTHKPYRGVNVFLLSAAPYGSPHWLTFNQAKSMGGTVKRGEKCSPIVFWKFFDTRKGDGGQAQEVRRDVPLLRYFSVFNAEQCEGIAFPAAAERKDGASEPIDRCEKIAAGMPNRPKVTQNIEAGWYNPTLDTVSLPPMSQFEKPEGYYATLFHELVHSTAHSSRLNRQIGHAPSSFGSPDYSKEELVAEFGASFLCGNADIFPRVAENSAAYIAGWLRALKGDKRLLVSAASAAQKAADYILGVKPQGEE